ncbi:MAG: short-chain dehydrogenase [Frondihabitans sp.]|nr:short-chain dehydrogenase [Frondihabitans sp.]
MSKTIVVIGARPGLGLSIAKQFGSLGFDVALIARNKDKLDTLVAELEVAGVRAHGYPADVTDTAGLAAAIDAAAAELGPIDVLEYSPAPTASNAGRLAPVDAVHLNIEFLAPQLEYYLSGGITAV